jgi:hypothetical protein
MALLPLCRAQFLSLRSAQSREGAVLARAERARVGGCTRLVNIRTHITFDLKAIGGNYRETGTR